LLLFSPDFSIISSEVYYTTHLLSSYGLFLFNSKAFSVYWLYRYASSGVNFNDNSTPDSFKSLLNLRNKQYLVWSLAEYRLNKHFLGNKAGIYAFYSIISGRFYVGSAQILIFRINQHLNNPLTF